jgi:hypothetical protein
MEWGKRPTWTSDEIVSSSTKFPKGEYGRVVGRKFFFESGTIREDRLPTEGQALGAVLDGIKKAGGVPVYVNMHLEKEFAYFGDRGDWRFYHVTVVVDDAVFYGDELVLSLWVVVTLVIAGIVVTFLLIYPGVVYKLFGVSPSEALTYAVPNVLLILVIGGLVLGGLWLSSRGKNNKRR